jgi:hypothetical protein
VVAIRLAPHIIEANDRDMLASAGGVGRISGVACAGTACQAFVGRYTFSKNMAQVGGRPGLPLRESRPAYRARSVTLSQVSRHELGAGQRDFAAGRFL